MQNQVLVDIIREGKANGSFNKITTSVPGSGAGPGGSKNKKKKDKKKQKSL